MASPSLPVDLWDLQNNDEAEALGIGQAKGDRKETCKLRLDLLPLLRLLRPRLLSSTLVQLPSLMTTIPKHSQAREPQELAPNYANMEAWSAHPARMPGRAVEDVNHLKFPDEANVVPPKLRPCDCFFVHDSTLIPAVSLPFGLPPRWNAPLREPKDLVAKINEQTDLRVAAGAAPFNRLCRVYAPRYRQVNVMCIALMMPPSPFAKWKQLEQALEVAYQDLRSAFLHFLQTRGADRPFFIAGHSQGTMHLTRLVQEEIDPYPCRAQRFLHGYLAGQTVPLSIFQEMKHVRPSQSPTDLCSISSWRTAPPGVLVVVICGLIFHAGKGWKKLQREILATNPITWRSGTSPSSKVRNAARRAFNLNSGSTAAMASQSYCQRMVQMTGKKPEDLHLAYLGTLIFGGSQICTPTYDLEKFRKRLTDPFIAMGVSIHPINLVESQRLAEEDHAQMLKSDIILVSGGNTLYAMDLWRFTGVVDVLLEMKDKALFCGGSAGANCWFDAGHSDSMDPMTFRRSARRVLVAPSKSLLSLDLILPKVFHLLVLLFNLVWPLEETKLAASTRAFAVWSCGCDGIVTWGDGRFGGDSSKVQDQLKEVKDVQASYRAFAAILSDGSVVTWGNPDYGGDASKVRRKLKDVKEIRATDAAFAAVLADGSIVTWGSLHFGGDTADVDEQLRNVQQIQATESAFAAIVTDGSVVTWGDPNSGGDSSRVQDQLRSVQQIHSTCRAFAAILSDGSVVTWGHVDSGGDTSQVQRQLKDVQEIHATHRAFAAILSDGSVVTWGDAEYGGDMSEVEDQLRNPPILQVQSTCRAFFAIKSDSVVAWGDPGYFGYFSAVPDLKKVQQIHATSGACAAILDDGSVVTWGNPDYGADTSEVQDQLTDVTQIQSTHAAFAALRSDGTVVAWGNKNFGMAPHSDELSEFRSGDEVSKRWEYIRIDGLRFLPGLCCPHHDRVQSNGILRSTDFEELLKRHPTERGICIDDWTALELFILGGQIVGSILCQRISWRGLSIATQHANFHTSSLAGEWRCVAFWTSSERIRGAFGM
eukprot:symbB.v1.2.011288.t1/scaffold754.1/size165080/2